MVEPEKSSGRGGYREGAGRKPGYESKLKKEPTRVVRLPVSIADTLDELLALRNDVNATTQELKEQLEVIQVERDELEEKNRQLQEQLAVLQRDYVALQLKLSSTIPIQSTSTVGAKATTHPKPTCPKCGSTGNHKNLGTRNNKRRWTCVDCKKTFSVDIGIDSSN